jgi:hypothetical protein
MASLKNLVKTGFGLGVGLIGAQMIFLLLGIVFFILGRIELKKARARGSSVMFPYVLMVLGVVLAGGLGFGLLMGDVDTNF